MSERFVDELEFGFGWIHSNPGFMRRCAHALAVAGRVWLFDPTDVEGLDARISALGEPAGVIQLLPRHERDCAQLARRYGVPHRVLDLGDAPFEPVRVSELELAVWWPETKTLVVPESVGTSVYFRALGERVGIHPYKRFDPPRVLLGYEPEHLLVGHGAGVHGPGTARALHGAIRWSRLRAPLVPLNLLPRR